METLPATQQHQPDPFGRMVAAHTGVNVGAVAIEQERAIAEAQGQLTLAKRFPRSMTAAINEFMDACRSTDFAATAFYSVPNRGSGPSIRLAEEAARCYGNFVYGHRELSRSEGKSEIEVYAWDMEKNNRSSRQITVMHVTDTKNGPKRLTDQADIDNKIANVASKQMRGRILALMPKHMIAAGVAEAKRTLAGGGEKPISERLIAMAGAFGKFGVTNDMLISYLGHPVDNTTIDELADLMGIYNAIREGAKASEYFGASEKQETVASTAAAITQQAKQAAAIPSQQQAKAPAQAPEKPAQEAKAVRRNTTQPNSSGPKEQHQESTQNDPVEEPQKEHPQAASNPSQQSADDDVF
jgi:hypothetical protein